MPKSANNAPYATTTRSLQDTRRRSARLRRPSQSGAVVLIAHKNKIAYFRSFGFRDRENHIPMAKDSIFQIASMTKPIVSIGAMMLAEGGRLYDEEDLGPSSRTAQLSTLSKPSP
jgi:CubicO group peptidase (beta-lactamase class C family)